MYLCVCPSQINYCFLAFLDHSGQLQPLTFVQYRFDRAEHPIEITKHSNSLKNKGPFKRIKASTIAMLKKGLDKHQPVKFYKLKILREKLLVHLHHVICLVIVANYII